MLKAFENLIDWTNVLLFHSVHESFFPHLEKIVTNKYSGQCQTYPGILFTLPAEKNNLLDLVTTPKNIITHKLNAADVPTLVSTWRFADKESIQQLTECVNHSKSITVCTSDKDDLELKKVLKSWAVLSPIGAINLLRTDERFRKQGLGAFTIKEISLRKIQAELVPIGEIETFNDASGSLFTKVGFEKAYNTFWLYLTRG